MIVLKTPGVGFSDFEMRIALGLCRVGLDCVEPDKVWLEEEFDRFLVYIDTDNKEMLSESLGLWCLRVLSDQTALLRTPGFRPRHLEKQAKGVAKFGLSIKERADSIFELYREETNLREGAHSSACRHQDKGMFGALLAFSPQLGQPPKRNNPKHQITLPLCPFCGALGLLGTFSFQIDLQISSLSRGKKERLFFLPRFRKVNGEDLLSYIAATKHIRPYLYDIPAESALLALLSLYPHISRLKMPEVFFVARGDFSGNVPRYQDFREESVKCELSFLKRSSFNVALAQDTYQKAKSNSEPIRLLAKTLKEKQPKDAISYYREYASASEGKYLVYYDSTRFIAKEVLGMDESLIDDQNIGAVASMLRFFVSKQKFGYVDNLRSSRTEDEFEKHLLSALRDAASVHSKPEDKKDDEKRLYIPNETVVREFLKLLHKDFEKVRTLVCLLSFTYWKKEVEQDG